MRASLLLLLCVVSAPACRFGAQELREKPLELADMEESLAHAAEPNDEAARRALDPGSFTGITLAEVRGTLDEMIEAAPGVEVVRVIENSPADKAGIRPGDWIVGLVAGAVRREVSWPSEWREFELASAAGTSVTLTLDRAGIEQQVELTLEARVRPTPRAEVARVEEAQRVGIRLRTPTEVEARAAGLAPGAGAWIVGLARQSPWRAAGLQSGDLIVAVGGAPLAHPEQLLSAIRSQAATRVSLEVLREGRRQAFEARLSQREHEFTNTSFPLLWDYERARGRTTLSLLLGLLKWETTPVAWELRLFWFVRFGGGQSDRLEEVQE